jgi:hypothetical protein
MLSSAEHNSGICTDTHKIPLMRKIEGVQGCSRGTDFLNGKSGQCPLQSKLVVTMVETAMWLILKDITTFVAKPL